MRVWFSQIKNLRIFRLDISLACGTFQIIYEKIRKIIKQLETINQDSYQCQTCQPCKRQDCQAWKRCLHEDCKKDLKALSAYIFTNTH